MDKNVVKRAERWGHRAIAITDHGVAHSFPNAWHSAKNIKILYGVEAYYINDVDDRVVIHGDKEQDFTGEIVCFDIETTGLDKPPGPDHRDRRGGAAERGDRRDTSPPSPTPAGP